MTLQICTLTGVDESVSIRDLREISEQYPFIEWGVLYSHSTSGVPRYPSLAWIKKFITAVPSIKKALHICGQEAVDEFFDLNKKTALHFEFDRIQINKSYLEEKYFPSTIRTAVSRNRPTEIIFQFTEKDQGLKDILQGVGNPSFLYDESRGAGIIPQEWKTPLYGFKCGYAGGLGPENLEILLPLIERASLSNNYWIDVETKLRTNDKFDANKCRRVAEIVQQHIEQNKKGLLAQPFPEGDMSNLFANLPPY
jgi:hypothetical protein